MASLAWVAKFCLRRYRRSQNSLLLDDTDDDNRSTEGQAQGEAEAEAPTQDPRQSRTESNDRSPRPAAQDSSIMRSSESSPHTGFQAAPLIPLSPPPLDNDSDQLDEDDEFDIETHQTAARSLSQVGNATGAIPKSGTSRTPAKNVTTSATGTRATAAAPKERDYTSTAIFHYE